MTDLDKHIQEYLEYNPDTGIITWKKKKPMNNRVKVGDEAGTLSNSKGYRIIQIDSKFFKAHRISWFLYYGEWPKHMIDHINGIKDDNRISNLREATAAQNQYNTKSKYNSSSKYKGVSWVKTGKWAAKIRIDGKDSHLGSYLIEEEAALAYNKAASEYFGEYAYLNEIIKTP